MVLALRGVSAMLTLSILLHQVSRDAAAQRTDLLQRASSHPTEYPSRYRRALLQLEDRGQIDAAAVANGASLERHDGAGPTLVSGLQFAVNTAAGTGGKVLALAEDCDIFTAESRVQCGSWQTSQLPIPACCSGTKNGDLCVTKDSGVGADCTVASPLPACCFARNQPASICTTPDNSTSCYDDNTPVPACCSAQTCTVNIYASNINCPKGTPKCCPA